MRSTKLAVASLCLFASLAEAQEEKDLAGAKDHPLLSRMPGSYLTKSEEKDFDSVDVSAYLSGADAQWEGKVTRLAYSMKTGSKPVSMTQIVRNFEGALKKIGGQVVSSGDRVSLAKVHKGGATTFVMISAFNEGHDYELVIVETKAMEQEVVADAAALKAGLARAGKIAVYGIYFDTNKAVVKPSSAPTLEQILKLLKDNPKLELYIVGHTDSVGNLEANLKLSAERASAVAQALVSRGVAAKRLKPAGVGPYCPEASNASEEGRAKNRRVELVER